LRCSWKNIFNFLLIIRLNNLRLKYSPNHHSKEVSVKILGCFSHLVSSFMFSGAGCTLWRAGSSPWSLKALLWSHKKNKDAIFSIKLYVFLLSYLSIPNSGPVSIYPYLLILPYLWLLKTAFPTSAINCK
jgi:hypothetical protein